MAEWLEQVSQWHEMYVIIWSGRVELGVCSTSVNVILEPKIFCHWKQSSSNFLVIDRPNEDIPSTMLGLYREDLAWHGGIYISYEITHYKICQRVNSPSCTLLDFYMTYVLILSISFNYDMNLLGGYLTFNTDTDPLALHNQFIFWQLKIQSWKTLSFNLSYYYPIWLLQFIISSPTVLPPPIPRG